MHAVLGLLGATLVGAAWFVASAWRPEIPAVELPDKAGFDPALITHGAELTMLGNCNVCHTKADGRAYAGGRGLQTPFGTIYATNITPDPDTGIGRWSETAFLRAMREGVRRDGSHLYPVFPYDHFTKVSAADLRAIYAFLMTRAPVRADTPANVLPFPLSMRTLVAGWKLMFLKVGELEPDPVLSRELNRGAYLVEGLAHCGACHTPRNGLGAERNEAYLGGGETEGWYAPALNASTTAPVAWTQDQLFAYLRNGFVPAHGVAAGPMQPVVNNLNAVAEADVRAIAAYIAALVGPPTAGRSERLGGPGARGDHQSSGSRTDGGSQRFRSADGAIIYAGACAPCHEATGQRFSARGIHLASSKLVTLPDARNLAHVILEGIAPPQASPAALMPGFADTLSDAQVVALMTYLRRSFSDRPSWGDVEDTVRRVRRSAEGS
ncbi:MAG TPA: cytochrome c [Hyphomicrobiaceae bacterium]|nr:cytochrome c [Hyphomicrobiaceae bacterium]